jgi:hypothetical protein
MEAELGPGDRARVIVETDDERFPLGTIVHVVEILGGFGPGPHRVSVYREGKANIVESALSTAVLERIG